MIEVASYSPSVVFAAMEESEKSVEAGAILRTNEKAQLPDGRTFKRVSERLILFRSKGTACVTCGVEGTVFILETRNENINPHLNLYAFTGNGERILMTKDHIHPRSKGGKDEQENYAPMCRPCNVLKADILPETTS